MKYQHSLCTLSNHPPVLPCYNHVLKANRQTCPSLKPSSFFFSVFSMKTL